MSAAVAAPLPTDFLTSDDMMVELVRDKFVAKVERLNSLGSTYETVRSADAKADEVLQDSDDQAAADFRDATEEAEATIAKIREETAARIKNINAEVAKLRAEAVKSVIGDILGDINLDELQKEYTDTYNTVKKFAATLADAVPPMKEWVKTLPSPTRQANGGNSARTASGDRQWTPWFASITVDNVPLETPTLSQVAKTLGVAGKAFRQVCISRLLGVIVTPDNLSTDPNKPNIFSVQGKDGQFHDISVVGRAPKAKDETDDSDAAAE